MEGTQCLPAVSTPTVETVNGPNEQLCPKQDDSTPEADNLGSVPTKSEEIEKKTASEKQTESTVCKHSNGKQTENSNKKSSREEKYSRRKDERSVEQVLRALNGLESPQDKLTALCKKYADVIDENRKFQAQVKNMERRLGQVEREKDSAQSEYSKAVLTRSRLEGLCRELQRQNKAIKDESLLRIREEEEKRKEVSNKFQSTLAEITSLMQQNNEKNTKLRDYNIEMTTKLKSVCEQYELRVQQVEKISKQMQLEAQLADAKLAKARMEAAAEKEGLLREKQELLVELASYQAKCQELQQTEIDLRGQIELYTSKYDEFQNALSRSNQVFGGFKGEMDKMSKKIVKLEKETSTWKSRWEKSHQALLEMAADKQQRDADLALANRQSTQLHKLCRTLTEERAKLMAQINANSSNLDPEKKEKEAAELTDNQCKLNETLDSLQAVLTERNLLVENQKLERYHQEMKEELEKHQKSLHREESSSHSQPNSKGSEKKKGKKQKNIRQIEEKSVDPVCKGQTPATNLPSCTSKLPSDASIVIEEKSVDKVESSLSVKEEEVCQDLIESQPVEMGELPSMVSVNNDKVTKSTISEDSMPSLEPCDEENPEPTEVAKEEVPSKAECTAEPSSAPDSIASAAPFSYAAALGCKVHDSGIDKSNKDLKSNQTSVPTSNEKKVEEVVEISPQTPQISVNPDVPIQDTPSKAIPVSDVIQEIPSLSSVTSTSSNTSAINSDGSSGEQHCVQNASPLSKKGKEQAKRKKK